MTCIGARPAPREATIIAQRRRHHPRASHVSVDETWAAYGARGMTGYAYDREHHSAACALGAGLASACRCGSLSRLASPYGARKRPGRSEEAPLYLLAAGLGGSGDFGRSEGRSPRTAVPLRLARGHQRAAPDRGRISSGEVAARHPAYPPTVLLGNRFVARFYYHEAILATLAGRGRRFAGASSAAGYGDIALFARKRPPSVSLASCSPTSADQTRRAPGRGRLRPFCFRQRWRYEVRAFDAPAPHHQRKPTAWTLRSPMREPTRREERQ